MKIKVCGMRDIDNVRETYEAGVRLMGFIFYEKSKRFVPLKQRAELFYNVSDDMEKVGVFVNEDLEHVISQIKEYELDYVQLHGEESPEYCDKISNYTKVIKAFRVGEDFDFTPIKAYENVDLFIFDAKGKEYGGNGIQYDWSILKQYELETPFLLSGGIGPNDTERIKEFKHNSFIGIDINSGFEIGPGLKNVEQVKTFLNQL